MKKLLFTSTINDTKITFKEENATTPESFGLYDILNKINVINYFNSHNKKQYLDLTNSKHQDLFLRWYAILNAWFKKEIATKQQINQNFNSQQFNAVISKAIANEVNNLQKDPLYNLMVGTMFDEATNLIRTVIQMLNFPGFDIYDLLPAIGGFTSWIFKQGGDNFVVNADNVKHVEKVYNADPNQYAGYSTNLGSLDPTSKYGELVLQEFGLKSQSGSIDYEKGSLFKMINTWEHGGRWFKPW
ncbi:hypothetical protein P344_03280 [Spiroplasma mirum ATCC 29335]|uniref:Uncharacterized protein n=1 Tax=Spiroplasma mirum ATCC 29335 TaxID=838561 RepID=W0GQS0_9MOLU|nr:MULTISPECIES: hypothetical protein [Spiroplasma]AHF60979.1 hypothetical protein SMM_0554 [Spiroplasma mirum ATCC 29335]AHI57999.1 hypothetical protein P344_03280 [Spiroplasma mirum ATCC 29335]